MKDEKKKWARAAKLAVSMSPRKSITKPISIEEKIQMDMAIEDEGLKALAEFAAKPRKDQ